MTAVLSDSWQLTYRQLRNFARQPYFVAITLVQPMIWLLLFGQLFKNVSHLQGFPGGSYIGYLTPGVVVMTSLFSNGWSGMGYITIMERGVLDRLLVSPVSRASIITGGLGYQATTTTIQSLIVLGIGFIAGARFPGGPLPLLALLVACLLLGSAFSSFSNQMALRIRKEESVIAMVNFLVLPLSFLSTTLLPSEIVPGWIRQAARYNPVNWAVVIGRQTLQTHVDYGVIADHLLGLAAVAVAMAWIAARAFKAYQRSV
ncbi:MAG TPA: ABC transporter permease [Acidimicrobiales bacterium]|nr:ABC transporter permease [Acidimicrobiales bacterium]